MLNFEVKMLNMNFNTDEWSVTMDPNLQYL